MTLEISVVPRTRIPIKYTEMLRKATANMTAGKSQALAVTDNGDNYSYITIKSSWEKLCHKMGRKAHTHYLKLRLGYTVFLWWE